MRIASVVSGVALVASLGLVSSSPAKAEPEIKDVQARVDSLYHQAEQASERYNDAKLELGELNEDLGSVKADEKRAKTALDGVRATARQSILRQYGRSDLGVVSRIISDGDPSDLLSEMSTLSSYQQVQQGVFDDYATGLEALKIRREATQKRLNRVADLEAQLAEEKKTIDAKLADAKELLGKLKEEERREILSRGTVRTPSDVPASGRAAAAIEYAMAQVGDAYVFGAAGPSAFDCSGLTMMAWAQAGVGLPHSSRVQSGMGTPVSVSELQPGDLVFYYSPVSHVAMYIGNGMIVHAANPGAGVKVSSVNEMPITGARRVG